MAQSGYTPISIYYSSTATNVPTAGNLTNGELAINIADGKLYYKDSGGAVQVIASKAGNINVSSLSFGTTGLTPSTSTTGAITVAGTLVIGNGGTGQTSFPANQVHYGSFSTSANMTFDGSTLTTLNFAYTGTLTGGTGAFTTLSASSTVSGAGFSNYFAAPPTIGNTTPNAGTFTALTATSITDSGLTAGRITFATVSGLLADSANLTFNTSNQLIVGGVASAGGSVSAAVIGTGTTFLSNPATFGAITTVAGREVPMIYGWDGTSTNLITMLAGKMGFSINGTIRAVIDTSGNMGIGTSSPIDKLTVNGAVVSTAQTVLSSSSTGAIFDYTVTGNTTRIISACSTGASQIQFLANLNAGALGVVGTLDSSGNLTVTGKVNSQSTAKAWVFATVSGSAVNIQSQLGVSSVTYVSTGLYRVNFSTAFVDTAYAAVGGYQNSAWGETMIFYNRNTSSCDVAGGVAAPGTELTSFSAAFFR